MDGALTTSTMLLRSSPRSRKTRWSPNWRLRVDQADLAAEFLVKCDRRVDRDGGRPDSALGAVESQDPPHRRPSEERLPRREPGKQALDPGEQLGWMERLDEVVIGARPEAADLLLDLPFGGQHDDRDVDPFALLRAGS